MARARLIPDLSPRQSYAAVAAKVVAVRTEEVFARHHEVLAVENIEALHDMRVATRRLRAALEVFAPCFPREPYRRALADVKRLADALGERRDRDVQIEWLERYAQARSGEERAAVLGFVEALRAEQTAANEALAALLEDVEHSALESRLQELAARATAARGGRRVALARASSKKARRGAKNHGEASAPAARAADQATATGSSA
jgi:CHAD domain-containing protein